MAKLREYGAIATVVATLGYVLHENVPHGQQAQRTPVPVAQHAAMARPLPPTPVGLEVFYACMQHYKLYDPSYCPKVIASDSGLKARVDSAFRGSRLQAKADSVYREHQAKN